MSLKSAPRTSIHQSTSATVQGENIAQELRRHVAHLDTCKHRGLFPSEERWRKRARACVETTALLVYHANAELSLFGDITEI